MTEDKINAYMTLYTALVTVAKLAAPMIPFMTEDIYRNLVCSVDKAAPISVHLCDYPICDEAFVDEKLEAEMEEVLDIVVLGRSVRNAANIKTKQPLSRMIVKADSVLPSFCTDIITEEINVKAVEFRNDLGDLVSYGVKPKFDSLKAKYPAQMGALIGLINKADGNAIVSEIEAKGSFEVTTPDGAKVSLEKEDLIIETKKTEGFEAASDYGITVALDTTLTPELIEEGAVREIISNIQKMRKNSGFEVMDHITVYQWGNENISEIMKKNEKEIAEVVLAEGFIYGEEAEGGAEIKVNGEKTMVSVKKIG